MVTIDSVREKAIAFRDMHFSGEMVILPNAWDHASAALMVEAGYPAIATTSAGIAFAQGYPDGERIGRKRMLTVVGRIASQLTVPVTADLEAGYGVAPKDVATTVRCAIEAGIVGCNIEDADPNEHRLLEFDLSVSRIRAARSVADKVGVPFVLNARTDPYLKSIGGPETNFKEAVRRANAYLAAGATCAYVPGPADAKTVKRLVDAINGPLNILASTAGRKGLTVDRLRNLGVRRISIGGSLMLATAGYLRDMVTTILEKGTMGYARTAIENREMSDLMASLPKLPN
ncbi:MAG: 2-methylisocitrate lyase [Rhodospirillaceae bacterium]|nr:2-methylisocitrate lyase [Rhodospirillaceae bacterium]